MGIGNAKKIPEFHRLVASGKFPELRVMGVEALKAKLLITFLWEEIFQKVLFMNQKTKKGISANRILNLEANRY